MAGDPQDPLRDLEAILGIGSPDTTAPPAPPRPVTPRIGADWSTTTEPTVDEPATEPGLEARYEILEPIGEGAFATVHRARDRKSGALVALKIVQSKHAGAIVSKKRTQRELSALMRLSHPNIVNLVGFELDQDGGMRLAFELLPGPSLKEVFKLRGRLTPEIAIGVARQLAAGLAAAHQAEVVHRDLKPANVLADDDGRLKIIDFGLVRLGAEDLTRLTAAGPIGTPRYLSPEQIRAPSEAGPPSDLYALGVILFEALEGRPPFPGPDVLTVLDLHLHAPPPPIADHGGLGPLVTRLMAKDPSARPTATEVLEALAALSRPATPTKPSRRAVLLRATIVLLPAGLLALAVVLRSSRSSPLLSLSPSPSPPEVHAVVAPSAPPEEAAPPEAEPDLPPAPTAIEAPRTARSRPARRHDRPEPDKPDTELHARVASRGLLVEDLAWVAPVEWAAFKAARGSERERAKAELLARVDAWRIDRASVREVLDGVGEKLRSAPLEAEGKRALEQQFLELRVPIASARALNEADLIALLRRTRALERAIAR